MDNDDKAAGCLCIIGVFLVAGLLLTTSFVGCDTTYSEGFRDGIVQKFSKKGLIFKSWEGTLIRDRMVQNDESNFLFSVDDPKVVEEIQNLKPNAVIRLHYRQVWKNATAFHETSYRVTKIEPLKFE